MPILFLLFIVIPIIEITVLINVGGLIGVWPTVGLVLLSAFIGVNMLRMQGLSTLSRAQNKMNAGQIPGQEMVEGIVLAVGGALLITPGFVTDIMGFSCLVPFIRKAIVRRLLSNFTVRATNMQGNVYDSEGHETYSEHTQSVFIQGERPKTEKRPGNGDVIDGEYRRED